jgi:membrane complex biogenesis BtpA family protein
MIWSATITSLTRPEPTESFHLVGVLHLPPLPGAVNYAGAVVREVAERAADDARVLRDAGFTHVMVQDACDMPQAVRVDAPTVAALAVVGAAVTEAVDIPVGVVVGHNDGPSAVAVAHAIGARFVRVKVLTGVSIGPTGWIEGCAHDVAAMRRRLGSEVEVWADVHEATSLALASTKQWAAQEALSFGLADTLVLTRDSGVVDALDDIDQLRQSHPGTRFVVGGRVSLDTIGITTARADGAILGSAIKGPDGRIAPDIAARFGAALPAGAVG